MPNHIGAFLKASKCFSQLNINITRVSYNKAVDSHTLFIDAEGTDELKKEIQEYVKTHTAPYKYPRIVEFVDELPKTISGKVRRVEIRKNDMEKLNK